MLYINLDRIPIENKKWQKKAKDLLKQLDKADSKEKKHEIIDKNHRYWKIFKEHLKNLSFNKCWYSDSINPASHYHVDHFRPKKKVIEFDLSDREGYWWLAFDITNFRLSGSVPNTKKGSHFAVKKNAVKNKGSIKDEVLYFLDPTKKQDVGLINFREDGLAIESAPKDEEPWDFLRANYTIDKLDLNYEDLVEARSAEWIFMTGLVKEINNKIKENNEDPSASTEKEIDGLKNQCRKKIASCTNLASTNRVCIRATGKRWAFELLEEDVDSEYCKNKNNDNK